MSFTTYDTVSVKRPCDEEEFEALVIGSCDTREIFQVLVWVDYDHPLGPGWIKRYAGKNSIKPILFQGGR